MAEGIVVMELKYCECCGGLLLRQAGSGATYCTGCAALVREVARSRSRRRGRPPKARESAQPSLFNDERPVPNEQWHTGESVAQERGEAVTDAAETISNTEGLPLDAELNAHMDLEAYAEADDSPAAPPSTDDEGGWPYPMPVFEASDSWVAQQATRCSDNCTEIGKLPPAALRMSWNESGRSLA